MRFTGNYDYYFFSEQPVSDAEERSEIYTQQRNQAMGFMRNAFTPSDDPVENIKKFVPLGLFIFAVFAMIICSVNKMVTPIVYIFGGVFVAFGIMGLLSKGTDNSMYDGVPQTGKMPGWLGGAIAMIIGLSVIIPELFVSKIGSAKVLMTICGCGFGFAGLLFIGISIGGFIRNAVCYKEEVNARCIGYLKSTANSESGGRSHLYVVGVPVFEYYYNGQTYQAFQLGDMRSGKLSPDFGSTVTIKVNADDPEDILFHKNIGAKIFAIILSLISIAVAVFIFYMMPTASDADFHVSTLGGVVEETADPRMAFDDDTIAQYLSTSDFTINYLTVEDKYREGDVMVIEVSNGEKIGVKDEDADRYDEGTSFYYVTPNDGGRAISFRADEYVYTGSHRVIGAPSDS